MLNHVAGSIAVTIAALAFHLLSGPALSQPYPSKAVRIVVGFPAGGPADAMARIISKKMSESAGQSFIIENRPGANGFLAGEFVGKSAPDGYTQWFSSGSTLSFAKYLYTKPPVDPDRDMALITQAVSVPQIFVVHPSLPVKNLQELAQFAARRPGQLNASVIGLGGLIHLGMELFKTSAGITMTNVQYKGAAPAIVDLVGGHVEVALFDVPAVMSYLPSGKMRALAVTSSERLKQLPQVPTTSESGFLSMRSDSWYGVAVPAATAPDLVQRLNKLWVASLRTTETRDLLYAIGVGAVGSSTEEFQTFRAAEGRKWGDLIRKMNLKLE